MAALDSLPPDQRAVLQLVLGQGRSYEDLASLLKLDADAVRARAHAAGDALGAGAASRPDEEWREEIVDYLLGQQDEDERDATRAYLAGSDAGREFAWALAVELAPLASDGLPEIPAGETGAATPAAAPAPAAAAPTVPVPAASRRDRPPAARGPRRSSRLGGALLLAGVAIVVAVVVVLLVSGGDDGKKKTSGSTSTTGTTTTAAVPETQINLTAAHKGSKALGIAQVVRQKGVRAMAIVGQDVPATSDSSFYAVWLYNSLSDAVRLGFTPAVGSDGKLQTLVPSLPSNATRFKELLITRETTNDPKKPGTFILRGNLSLKG